jgi:acyl-coenzyme A synthetase/AMP-(fatty) acid ligase
MWCLPMAHRPAKRLLRRLKPGRADKLNKWSLPKDIVFREELPLTRVGKVAYTELEREAAEEAAAG